MTLQFSRKILTPALVACFALVPAFASPVLAQGKKGSRDAAMQRCIHAAQTQYPDVNTEKEGRVAFYKACMTKAGQRP